MGRIGWNNSAVAKAMAIALVAATGTGCTAAMYQVKAEQAPMEIRVKAAPRKLPGPYQIQVDDLLTIRFYRNPELDQDVRVRPDGKISLPYVDDVLASGRTPDGLDATLTKAYTGELATPDVTVIVVEFGAQKVYVGGSVSSEGQVDLRGEMTMAQAIKAAGGFDRTARRDQVVLMRRDGGGNVKAWAVDFRQIDNGKHPELDIMLQPFDIIHVPQSAIANVNLWIDQYIRENLPINPSTLTTAAGL